MAILNFNKSKRYSGPCSDEAVRAYEDAWKAYYIEGQEPYIEIRKTFRSMDYRADALISVYKEGVVMSANGKVGISIKDMEDLQTAVVEARDILLSGAPPMEYANKKIRELESKAKRAQEEADSLKSQLDATKRKYNA